jgi:hypothetical protein
MGEARRRLSATQKFIKEHPHCFFCGGQRASATREHMPPKSLFDDSHRPDKLIMPACTECNADTSTADLTAAVISRWNYDIRDQERFDHKKLVAQMRRQAPALTDEWAGGPNWTEFHRENARNHLRNHGVPVPHDAGIVTIGPETIKQLNLFAHKVVLALYFENFRKHLPLSGGLCAYWKTKEDFARDGIPPFLLQIMPDYGTLVQGQWNARETFEYRYAVNAKDGLFACLAKLRRGLFIVGVAATDASVLGSEITELVHPVVPQTLLQLPRFLKKL